MLLQSDNAVRRHRDKYQKLHSLFKQFTFPGLYSRKSFQILRQQSKVTKDLLVCSTEAIDIVLAEEKKKSLRSIWYIMDKIFMETPGLF